MKAEQEISMSMSMSKRDVIRGAVIRALDRHLTLGVVMRGRVAESVADELTGALPDVPVIDMCLCESSRLILKPGCLYRFTAVPGCVACQAEVSVYEK